MDDFPSATKGSDAGNTAMPTVTSGGDSTELRATATDTGSPQSNTSTAGGVVGNPVPTWGAVAALGVVAAMV